jgi:ABC-type Fe3+-hydroxamate transport system substrate-binding protein
MFHVQDHTGKFFELKAPPQRIVSLVPSQTELLYDLGLEEQVVGITKFCIHPAHWFKSKQRIGGTKNVNIEVVRALQPDLVIANKEENVKEQINAIESFCPVYTTIVDSCPSALRMIRDLGIITHATKQAEALATQIESTLFSFQPIRRYRSLYLIWKDPYMSVGGDTFISNMIKQGGFDNLLDHETRYPILDTAKIKALNPELILLSSEPYPFKQKHIHELAEICPKATTILVDGEMFSWYGSRMLLSAKYFESLQHQLIGIHVH